MRNIEQERRRLRWQQPWLRNVRVLYVDSLSYGVCIQIRYLA
jgi:hypothetical protein